ncbi:H-NS family nucleoid-associated regulatory protein [Leisingera sp. D0M16]|uniref:H-NS histone family protein n=1 Tax=Leisingera coralii TaxID=3351347 RepID=UPI003B794DD7
MLKRVWKKDESNHLCDLPHTKLAMKRRALASKSVICFERANKNREEHMGIDLTGLSPAELDALAKDIEARKVEVEKEAKQNAYTEMLAVAEKHGVAFEDIIALHGGKARKPGAKAPAKYANPEDTSQTWSGRGRKPAWVHAALEAGKSLDDFAI